MIASLTVTLLAGIQQNPAVPQAVSQQADAQLASGVPFLSDAEEESALAEAGVTGDTAAAIADENTTARLHALRAALAIIAVIAAAALLFCESIPKRQPGSVAAEPERGPPVSVSS